MSNKLLRLGAFAFEKRWWVLASWIVILGLAIGAMQVFQKPVEDSFSIPGTESQVAFDKLAETMPGSTGGTGRIVFKAPEGQILADVEDTVDATLAAIGEIEGVEATVSPFETQALSEDETIGLAQVQLTGSMAEVPETLADDIDTALETAREQGVTAEAGGDISNPAPGSIMGPGEIVGIVVAAVTLIITFGALVAAGMPLLTAFIGVGIGVSTIYALGSVVSINTVTPILAIMLGMAVGIDYALFIVTRHRKYLMDGMQQKQAAARAIATAGNAVIFAALTVVIALAALTVVGIPFLSTMGLAAAGTVAIAAAVAVTLIPALLGFAGLKVLSKKQRADLAINKGKNGKAALKKRTAYKYVTFLTRRPLIPIVLGVGALLAIALPVTQLQLGFPGDGSAPKDSTERKAYDLISEGFGAGYNGPLLIVVELPDNLTDQQATEKTMHLIGALNQAEGVAYARFSGVSEDKRTIILQAIPESGPTEPATKGLVAGIREQGPAIAGEGTNIYVTGTTAITIDMDNLLASALPKYLLLVVGLSFILLVIVFRSIIVPVKATLGFLLSIAATFGALVMFFQWGWFDIFEITPIVSFLPIIVIGIVFGLAMDYEFFLVSGMHEAYLHEEKGKPKAAVINGYTHNARVVTAAAIIMISVFSGFIFSHMQMVQMIGFALAVGILFDAFIVRMTLVPAVMALVGKAGWWLPKWLGRIIPHVSIEGDDTTVAQNLQSTKK